MKKHWMPCVVSAWHIAVLVASFVGTTHAVAQGDEARHTVPAQFIAPSATTLLKPGQKIDQLFLRNLQQPYVLQRLTDRSYFVERRFYATTFYVGDQGVLLFDAPEAGGADLLKAIREVTRLPVTTVVYSHFHVDHVGGIQFWLDEARKAGRPLQIVAARETAEKMEFLHSTLPRPTTVLSRRHDSFRFENLRVELLRFEHAAHTDDHAAWLLRDERVLHSPDLLNPDQLPFLGFAVSDTVLYHDANLRQVEKLPWDFLIGGHGNVGSRDDVVFELRFLDELLKATRSALEAEPLERHIDPKAGSHAAFARTQREAVTRRVMDALRPAYGEMYGYDASMPANIELAIRRVGSYR